MEKQRQTWDTAVDDLSTDEPSGNISVFVRVRPLHVGQDSKNSEIYSLVDVQVPRTVHVAHPSIQALTARVATKTFEADGVLPPDADNAALWASLRMDATLNSVLNKGRTFYLCAYGQTGSGKTFSTTSVEGMLVHAAGDFADDVCREAL
jgi:kinesin family protein 2/24